MRPQAQGNLHFHIAVMNPLVDSYAEGISMRRTVLVSGCPWTYKYETTLSYAVSNQHTQSSILTDTEARRCLPDLRVTTILSWLV